ncbi:MAG: hypothetical protein WBV23_06390 [Desulfobaccales bacterium]
MAENIVTIQLRDYPRQPDETLYEIMAYFGQTYDNSAHGFVDVRYKYAYEIMQLRQNKYLVEQTARLVNKTIKIAKWTMIVAIGTAVLAVAALITLYSLPK